MYRQQPRCAAKQVAAARNRTRQLAYMSEEEKLAMAVAKSLSTDAAVCNTIGCRRKTWDGRAGSKCCRTCAASNGMQHGPTCEQKNPKCTVPGCSRETWDGKAGSHCCRTCAATQNTNHGATCEHKNLYGRNGRNTMDVDGWKPRRHVLRAHMHMCARTHARTQAYPTRTCVSTQARMHACTKTNTHACTHARTHARTHADLCQTMQ